MTLLKQESSPKKRGRVTRRVAVLNVLGILLVGLVLASTATAQNIVRLTPSESPAVAVPSIVALDLEIEFTDSTSGGGVEVSYDANRLVFISFTFSADPAGPNFGLVGPADGDPNQPLEIGAGWNVPVSGVNGIGTFLFRVIAGGSAAVSIAESPLIPGPWFDSQSPFGELVVSFGSAMINGIPAVPSLGMPGLMVCSALLILLTIFMMSKRELLEPEE
jgi:hypothetical protein